MHVICRKLIPTVPTIKVRLLVHELDIHNQRHSIYMVNLSKDIKYITSEDEDMIIITKLGHTWVWKLIKNNF